MKKGKLTAIFSILFLGTLTVSVFADNSTPEVISRILDGFNGKPYVITEGVAPDGTQLTREYKFTWKAAASKFTTKTANVSYPQVGVVNTIPAALQRLPSDGEFGIQKSLGVQASFDRLGHNWVDVYPTLTEGDGAPAEIPLLGRTQAVDVWVWGSNKNCNLEAYIRDNRGVIHVIQLGSLRYTGWRNLRGPVPASAPLVANVIPRSTHATTFVKFRIWTDPNEKPYIDVNRDPTSGRVLNITPIYVYFSQLKVLTDTYESFYDGDQLGNPAYIERLWNADGAAGGNNQ
jgi:hypothetical protein